MGKTNQRSKQLPIVQEIESPDGKPVFLNKEKALQSLHACNETDDINGFRLAVNKFRKAVFSRRNDTEGIANIDGNGDTAAFRRDILLSELEQILAAKTFSRGKYYLDRLIKGIKEVRTSRVNDINLLRWKEYDDIFTDSL